MSKFLFFIRFILPSATIFIGVLMLIIRQDDIGLDGSMMMIGAGLSIWLLNLFFRISVHGETERSTEDQARAFFEKHGRWPEA